MVVCTFIFGTILVNRYDASHFPGSGEDQLDAIVYDIKWGGVRLKGQPL